MKKMLVAAVILFVGWHYFRQSADVRAVNVPSDWNQQLLQDPNESSGSSVFSCDGRTHCSQMTSCAEAAFFTQNCPGTKMDGDNDGIPCESQWCGH